MSGETPATPASCELCERAQRIRAGADPFFVKELQESYVVLADAAAYPGYCVLFLKGHHEHLELLPLARQLQFHREVAKVAGAVRAVSSPWRINYACLGNIVPHLHWHVIPRFQTDPDPKAPIWSHPKEERERPLPEQERSRLIQALRKILT